MTKVLFKDGVIQFDDTSTIQIIPDASTAADCVCCDALPDCSFCSGEGEGGPFRRLNYSQVVTGFPATQYNIYFFHAACGVGLSGSGTKTYVFKCSGLDAINGTYEYSSNDACQNGGLVVDLSVTIVAEYWEKTVFQFPGPPCANGTLISTYTWTSARLTLGPDRFSLAPHPNTPPANFSCYPIWEVATDNGGLTGSLCSGYSNEWEGASNQSGASGANLCPDYSDFTYGFTTSVTGVS